ncbi:MAG: redoxin domain-containing protein [Chloroflexota bacterium]
MRHLLTLSIFALVMATSAQAQGNTLRNRGPAPELQNNVFLNTETPLRLADLRGSVVLLEFWTFDCINCIRTLPYVQAWHEAYADEGLVVIGDHYPEFGYERDLGNVAAAIERLGVTYPIAQDNNRATWAAYNQRYWPTIYLIDKWGDIRYQHIGEGRYATTEAAIQQLLAEPYTSEITTSETTTSGAERQYLRATEFLNVRRGPGTNHQRVGTISPDAVFVVLSEVNGWYEIEFDGEGGRYVSGEYAEVRAW